MRVYVESILSCKPQQAWSEVKRSRLLLHVIRPLLKVSPLPGERLPERWRENDDVECRLRLFGVLPLGRHRLHFERVDETARVVQSREGGVLVRQWDHKVRIESAARGRTRYSDEIEIDAGLLTPIVWAFANLFYRHRQRRWRGVARQLAAS